MVSTRPGISRFSGAHLRTIARCFASPRNDLLQKLLAFLKAKQPTDRSRPFRKLRAVGVEHRNRQPVHAERHAAGMGESAARVLDIPRGAEMVAVIVEAHAGGRLFLRAQRHEQFELQRLLLLADRLHLADAAEEGIVGIVDAEGKPEVARDRLRLDHPAFAEIRHIFRAADADIFAHPERLQPVEMARRLVPETIGGDVKAQAALRQRAPRGRNRIDRIAGGRRQHEVGRRERRGPVAAGIEAADGLVDLALGAVQSADAAEQVRKAL